MYFCSPGDINTAPSCLDSTVATVMTRFYPQLKIGHILVSLDVKPGYGIYAIDFQILKNNAQSQEEKILFPNVHLWTPTTNATRTAPMFPIAMGMLMLKDVFAGPRKTWSLLMINCN
ncbi:E4 SUMO-protein ligase PIAL2-like isoform X2 [Humulus lupulus]|uniref:E4 SUMO-protein ligase PIAL2-like isoform X2 n=1 Tax=Humulus lupulus TaxID=3486 RepID=UPI002B41416F|nr:E4 SUMO-protein ligase PIAL2-like isoform X2 [Humulus lupulus]